MAIFDFQSLLKYISTQSCTLEFFENFLQINVCNAAIHFWFWFKALNMFLKKPVEKKNETIKEWIPRPLQKTLVSSTHEHASECMCQSQDVFTSIRCQFSGWRDTRQSSLSI